MKKTGMHYLRSYLYLLMVCTAASLLAVMPVLAAKQVVVTDARIWAAPDHTRIVFDINGAVDHKLFTLDKPDRIVIDLSDARLGKEMSGEDYRDKGLIKSIRSAERNKNDLRVVLDLSSAIKPKSFILKPTQTYGYRLVLDLHDSQQQQVAVKTVQQHEQQDSLRDLVIAIDAGHGGEDPGAIGYRGTREKDVVMAIARRLQKLIDREQGMRSLMIRDGDYYVGLRNRIKKARNHRADMFISIHADAFQDKRARGASVYALSKKGATNEAARWLAESENSSDFIGGVSLEDKDDLLTSVLLDLSQNGTIEASLELGSLVLSEIKGLGKVHKRRVGQAGFAVLKSPDIPSILVETAFISNPDEERNLRDPGHQQKMAASIMDGIRGYFARNSVPGTRLANRRHVISRGDTLSEIARRYSVSASMLRTTNGLKSDRLRVGDVLRIPL